MISLLSHLQKHVTYLCSAMIVFPHMFHSNGESCRSLSADRTDIIYYVGIMHSGLEVGADRMSTLPSLINVLAQFFTQGTAVIIDKFLLFTKLAFKLNDLTKTN